eukprot:5715473-Alexandrium_andersonii.AAC.1
MMVSLSTPNDPATGPATGPPLYRLPLCGPLAVHEQSTVKIITDSGSATHGYTTYAQLVSMSSSDKI